MSIKLFIYSTILIPRVQQLYILASVSLSLCQFHCMQYIQNYYYVSFRFVKMNLSSFVSVRLKFLSQEGTGLSKPHPLATSHLIHSFEWDGMLKECKVVQSMLLTHTWWYTFLALINEDQCQNKWDPLKCFFRQTSITTRNVADGFA